MARCNYLSGIAACVLASSLLALAGCGGRAPVDGTVTLDGKPVDGGVVVFIPEGDSGGARPKAGGPITEGKFHIPGGEGPAPGKYRVEIHWEKNGKEVVPSPDPPSKYYEKVEHVPPEYNTKSTLVADVKSSGNSFTYDLKTPPGFKPVAVTTGTTSGAAPSKSGAAN